MKTTSKRTANDRRCISTLLTLALVFSLLTAIPMTANAADVNTLKTTIESFSHGGTGSGLTATVSGSAVTVTGSVAGATSTLSLNIDSEATVIWKAALSGNISSGGYMIILTGSGVFNVVEGGAIKNNSGNGGAIRSNGSVAIAVSGGAVSAADGTAIYLTDENAAITVSGGTVSTYIGNAIKTTGANATVTVSGGFVFSQGKDLFGELGVISMPGNRAPTISGTGIVCAWYRPYGFLPEYNEGTTIELFTSPTDMAKWGRKGDESGIVYSNGSNTGFFPVFDVLVHAAATPPPVPTPTPTPTPATPTSGIKVIVNGVTLSFTQPPVSENGSIRVPMRAIFEALGAKVEWEPSTKTVTAIRGDVTIKLVIGSDTMVRNGVNIKLSVPAIAINGSTMVPIRAVSEALGADVKWSQSERTVTIKG